MIFSHCIVFQFGTIVMELKNKIVSVVIPTYNRVDYLCEAIKSVLNQTWTDIEIIVVDDASTDNTREVCRKNFPEIILIKNEISVGGGEARNIGIRHSKGEYIAFLDDDDRWVPHKIERQMQIMLNKEVSLVSCCYYEVKGEKHTVVNVNEIKEEQDLLYKNDFGGASMFLTKKYFLERVGGFNKTLKSGQDWDLLLKLWEVGSFSVCKEPLVFYREHLSNMRITNSIMGSYCGLRDIFFLYRSRMSSETRLKVLAELIFYRVKLFGGKTLRSKFLFLIFFKKVSFRFFIKFSLRLSYYFLLKDRVQ